MVNLVIVSHSARLGEGVGELAQQMLMGGDCKIAIAAGIDDPQNPIGTDPIKVMEAIESVADADHVLVMMDIGSALLSAETALDLLDPTIAAKVRLCAAPLVEGTLAATVSAATGADIDKVIADAMNALEAKREQLGLPSSASEPRITPSFSAQDASAKSVSVVIKNPNGLHVRPASRLVATLSAFNADLLLEKNGKCVTPDSLNQISLLQVRWHDTVRLLASGEQADDALAAFSRLAAENFGESLEDTAVAATSTEDITGNAFCYAPTLPPVRQASDLSPGAEQARLRNALDLTLLDLMTLITRVEDNCPGDLAAIFSGHHMLLDDPELFDTACALLRSEHCTAEYAWQQVLSGLSLQYRQLDDAYLQARYIDIDDLLHRTLRHLLQSPLVLPEFVAPAILLADDLFPSTVPELDPNVVKGICLREGSTLAHGALIAREMGIAWVCQQGDALNEVQTGERLTLDVAHNRAVRERKPL
ncbi:dihydroxyacetone kinase phosphoryl donor subunit DhaM [Citrobacter farmeri]|uniref:dihydroxyacetone kinase phosphoryl donor subunit DhaM n=1 Tax=Citrobacter farmeri TaxID=67824 RepID=UPI00189D4EDB|nr:dihydroxyacetone kinase phosphoryl donor subunit DhaM [Citrobacter farmeri]EKU0078287.1 dihydroxyacetone kinase subunit DhaM [Citrobacter farmeri]EKU0082788.1 dihydroxyacetone kinase subunit DhaM [Citrobacter farmeri]MBJ9133502.1 dihydroxyacetone kinase subunit DhaM [Citrobacter farmeri]MDZ7528617.1 dihydroxyacetone kinase phosphoryl donor subunit DhaM [Citrobacter farmeri]HCD2000743.1 dihydroxyacetone kinase subunit DhaM [Citrobacter farmeri]